MVEDKGSPLHFLSARHQAALSWFADHAGEEIDWPEPESDGLFLLNRAKGIHKPKGWAHALSVRQSINSPYPDKEIVFQADGGWTFDYFQEGDDPASWEKDYTNVALMRNIADGVPVGVVRQTKLKPNPRYHIMGLARVLEWKDGYFRLSSFEGMNSGSSTT